MATSKKKKSIEELEAELKSEGISKSNNTSSDRIKVSASTSSSSNNSSKAKSEPSKKKKSIAELEQELENEGYGSRAKTENTSVVDTNTNVESNTGRKSNPYKMTESEFNKRDSVKNKYGTYQNYLDDKVEAKEPEKVNNPINTKLLTRSEYEKRSSVNKKYASYEEYLLNNDVKPNANITDNNLNKDDVLYQKAQYNINNTYGTDTSNQLVPFTNPNSPVSETSVEDYATQIERDKALKVTVNSQYEEKYNNASDEEKRLLLLYYDGEHGEKTPGIKKRLIEEYGYKENEIRALSDIANQERNAEEAANDERIMQDYASEHPVSASVKSWAKGTIGGIPAAYGMYKDIKEARELKKSGSYYDPGIDVNNPYGKSYRDSKAIREQVMRDHDWNVRVFGRDVDMFDQLYGTGMSGLESIGAAVIPGGAAVLGLNAAVDTTYDLVDRGADTQTALAGGIAAGVFESLFEEVSIGKLKSLAALEKGSVVVRGSIKETVKKIALRTAEQTGVNFTEEALTELANVLYDTFVNGDISNYQLMMSYYQQNHYDENGNLVAGVSEEEAKNMVAKDFGWQIAEAGFGGALMGFGFGVGGSAMNIGNTFARNTIGAKITGKNIRQNNNAEAVMDVAKSMPEDSVTAKKLHEYEEKAKKKGEDISDRKVGRIYQELVDDYNDGSINEEQKKAVDQKLEEINEARKEAEAKKNQYKENGAIDKQTKMDVTNPEIEINGKTTRVYDSGEYFKGSAEGEEAKHVSVFKKKNGKLVFQVNAQSVDADVDGKAVKQIKAQDVELNEKNIKGIKDNDVRTIFEHVLKKNLSVEAANLLLENYDGEAVSMEYVNAFDTLKKQGELGSNEFAVLSHYHNEHSFFTEDSAKAIMKLGFEERKINSGLTDMRTVKHTDKVKNAITDFQLRVINDAAKKRNMEVIIVDDVVGKTKDGWAYMNGANLGDNRIVISSKADGNLLLSFFGHEQGHTIAREDAETFNLLKDKAQQLYKIDNRSWEDEINDLVERGYTKDKAEEEAVANILYRLYDRDTLEQIVAKKPKFVKGLIKIIDNIINGIEANTKLYAGRHADMKVLLNQSDEAKAILSDIKQLANESLDKIGEKYGNYVGGSHAVYEAYKTGKPTAFNGVKSKHSEADLRWLNSEYQGLTPAEFEKIRNGVSKGIAESSDEESKSNFSISDRTEYAPMFYSQMSKVVDGVKQDKLSTNGLINMLKGKGVKDEEILWSGIEDWLKEKGKSVTKTELQEFINNSMLQIDRVEKKSNDTEWEKYSTRGGSNYREVLFKLPGSDYVNNAMNTHWKDKGVLAHARIQDMKDSNGSNMLFIDEIQSDWHNEGHEKGYKSKKPLPSRKKSASYYLKVIADYYKNEGYEFSKPKIMSFITGRSSSIMGRETNGGTITIKPKLENILNESELEDIKILKQEYNEINSIPDAPFKNGKYVDFVLKNLLREAAENGYDKLAWTTADMQSKRWSDEYAEGYRIEYDQDMPKFLNKFGKKFGAKVGSSFLENGTEVWSIDITQAMKDSVLYEGQPMFSVSDRDYFDAVEKYGEDSKEAKNMVENAASKAGALSLDGNKPTHFYHGTPRADRVGTVFREDRATAGPMVFFSSSKDIATNYSNDKKDTSIDYDENYSSYEKQFRVTYKGKDTSIVDLWNMLPQSKKNDITRKAAHIGFDDELENIVYDAKNNRGTGGFDQYRIRDAKGNYLQALVDEWLNDGNLFGEESKFIDVLNLAGIDDVTYNDPNKIDKKVYDTYLMISNPFDATSMVDDNFINSLYEYGKKYESEHTKKESNSLYAWDKYKQNTDRFIDRLKTDMADGTSRAWTVIPDFVTSYLESLGYDGVIDKGGKYTEADHTVVIPFHSEQVKSADVVTYDGKGKIVPISERFNPENKDINFSASDRGYLKAINKYGEDSEEVSKIVEKAAKRNGYTEHVFHGTTKGGFTIFDKKYSDDHLSFFVSSNPNMSKTYTEDGDVKKLSKFDASKISDNDIIKSLEDEYGSKVNIHVIKKGDTEKLKSLSDEKIKNLIVKFRQDLREGDLASLKEESNNHNEDITSRIERYIYTVDSLVSSYLKGLTSIEELATEMGQTESSSMMYAYNIGIDARTNLYLKSCKDYISRVNRYIAEISSLSSVTENGINSVSKEDAYFIDNRYPEIFGKSEAIDLFVESANGIYGLYGDTNNQLVYDGEGRNWNDLKFTTPDGKVLSRTRQISAWAFDNGYSSVRIKNIYDNGGVSHATNTKGDVYIYFNPESLKSADPVTYDEDGNIIPLSKRFNKGNKDIRWSASDRNAEDIINNFSASDRNDINAVNSYYSDLITENNFYRNVQAVMGDVYSQIRNDVEVSTRSVHAVANRILKNSNSKLDVEALTDDLLVAYDYMVNSSKNGTYNLDDLMKFINKISQNIVENSSGLDWSTYYEHKPARDLLSGNTIYVDEHDRKEIENTYGSFASWKYIMSYLNNKVITDLGDRKGSYTTLDSLGSEAVANFPGEFGEPGVPYSHNENGTSIHYDSYAVQLADFIENKARLKKFQGTKYWENVRQVSVEDAINLTTIEILKEFVNVKQFIAPEQKVLNQAYDLKRKYDKKEKELGLSYKRREEEIMRNWESDIRDLNAGFEMFKIELENEANKSIKDKMKDYTERQETKERRRVLKNKAERSLRYLNTRLTNPDRTRHIPEGQRNLVDALLKAIPIGNGGRFSREKLGNLMAEYDKAMKNYAYLLGEESREQAGIKIKDDIEYIQNKLCEDKATGQPGARVRDLTRDDIEVINDVVEHVKFLVDTENKLFADNRRDSLNLTGVDALLGLNKKQSKDQGGQGIKNKAIHNMALFKAGITKPEYLMKNTSPALYDLYKKIRQGENTEAKLLREAQSRLQQIKKDVDYDPVWRDHKNKIVLENNLELGITDEGAMYVYALSKRNQGMQHLVGENGGVTIVDEFTGKRKTFRLNENDVNTIIDSLTDKQKRYVDNVMDYLSEDIAAQRNAVSKTLYGIELYKEKNYVPIQVDKTTVDTNIARPEKMSGIANQGSSKQLNKKATNPIQVSGFSDVINKHIYDSVLYCSYAVNVENLKRVFNFRNENGSVHSALKDVVGIAGLQQINKLFTDIDSGQMQGDMMPLNAKMMSRAKKAAVMANMSVIVQQPTAVFRAMLYIDPKYFVTVAKKSDIEEMYEWNGCAVKKQIGYFDVNMGKSAIDFIDEYKPSKEVKKNWDGKDKFKQAHVMQKIDDVASIGANKADEITWGAIWNACKKQIAEQNPELEGDAMLQKASELFQDTIANTQVYDSVFTKPEYMRSKEGFKVLATAFMSEPLTSFNMLADSVQKARTSKSSQASKTCVRAFACYAASLISNAAIKSLVYAMRDDDDDKSFWEKYIGRIPGSMVDDIFGLVPYMSDIINTFEGWDVSRMDMTWLSTIGDLVKMLKNDNIDTEKMIKTLMQAGSQLTGVAGYNAYRDVVALTKASIELYNNIRYTMSDGKFGKKAEPTTARGVFESVKDNLPFIEAMDDGERMYQDILNGNIEDYTKVYNNMIEASTGKNPEGSADTKVASALSKDERIADVYNAIAKGDMDKRDAVYDELIAQGFNRSTVNKAVKDYEDSLVDIVSADPRTKEAAEARYNMDYQKYMLLQAELVRTYPDYQEEIINKAITKELPDLNKSKKDFEAEDEEALKKSYDVYNAIYNGTRDDVANLYNTMLKNGVSEEAANKQVYEVARSSYKSGDLSETDYEFYATKYGGKSEDDLFWDEEATNGGEGFKKYDRWVNAVKNNSLTDEDISYYIDHGVKKETLYSNTDIKAGVLDGSIDPDVVVKAYVKLGYDYKKAYNKVYKTWLKNK